MRSGILKPLLTAILGLLFMLQEAPALAQDGTDNDPEFALSRAGDADKGERIFGRCRACHRVQGNRSSSGPNLKNIFGRPAGTAVGFTSYSKALRESGQGASDAHHLHMEELTEQVLALTEEVRQLKEVQEFDQRLLGSEAPSRS